MSVLLPAVGISGQDESVRAPACLPAEGIIGQDVIVPAPTCLL